MIGAAAVPALLNKGAEHTNNKLHHSQEWRGLSDFIHIHAVQAKEHSFPPSPGRGNA